MKTIKHILLNISLLLTVGMHSQTTPMDLFTGTWEYQENNEVFRVILWEYNEAPDVIVGHFEKFVVDDNGIIQNYIYASEKGKIPGDSKGWIPFAIYAGVSTDFIKGIFKDNTINPNLYDRIKTGEVKIEILSNNQLTNTVTARWTVKVRVGDHLTFSSVSPDFNVPTDIILTKVSD
ncbi:DUF6705 family protein [Psychroflexus sp. MBR-150]|jgi:hypothetical protein